MQIKRILCAIDFSEASREAVTFSTELARQFEAALCSEFFASQSSGEFACENGDDEEATARQPGLGHQGRGVTAILTPLVEHDTVAGGATLRAALEVWGEITFDYESTDVPDLLETPVPVMS